MAINNNFKSFGGDESKLIIRNNIGDVSSYYKANDVIHAYDHDLYNTQWSAVSCNILSILCTAYNSIVSESGEDLFGNQELEGDLDYEVRDDDFQNILSSLFENYIISTINKYGLLDKINTLTQYTELKSETDTYDIEVGSIYEVICLTNTDENVYVNPLYGIYVYRTVADIGYYTNDDAIFDKNNVASGKDTEKLDSRVYFKIESVAASGQNSLTINYTIWSNIIDKSRGYKYSLDSSEGTVYGRLMTSNRKIARTATVSTGSTGTLSSNYKLVFSQYRGSLTTKTLEHLFIRKIG